jgi:hypothetical protein
VKLIGYQIEADAKENAVARTFRNLVPSPCFARVGDQFLACSSAELGRMMIPIVKQQSHGEQVESRKAFRVRFFARGGADLLNAYEDRIVTQIILNDAVPPETARTEASAFISWVAKLGALQIESAYAPNDYRLDLFLSPQSSGAEAHARKERKP